MLSSIEILSQFHPNLNDSLSICILVYSVHNVAHFLNSLFLSAWLLNANFIYVHFVAVTIDVFHILFFLMFVKMSLFTLLFTAISSKPKSEKKKCHEIMGKNCHCIVYVCVFK